MGRLGTVVILGAGYDTRAARFPLAGVRYFEVDHPATQASKRERLARLDGYPIDAACYVSCNFEREDPLDRLAANTYDLREPAFVIWEGVVPYLSEPAIRATASRLAGGIDPRSLVGFDFVGKKFAAGQSVSEGDRKTREYVGDLGEPIRFGEGVSAIARQLDSV
jgi:methyltransferase (TIGR00027 family)